MKRLLLFVAFSALPIIAMSSDLPLSDGNRIVIEGDSYAMQYKWSCYLAAYWVMMNPSLNLHVQVIARSGTRVEQALTDPTGYHGYDEYNKTVYALQPNWVLTNYGEDGGDTTDQFISATTDLTSNYIIGENGSTPVFVGPFPELRTDGKSRNGAYETAEITLGANQGWQVGTAWHYLAPVWELAANWPILSTTLNSHVDTSGNILEFYAIVHTLGFSTVVANSVIDSSSLTLISNTNCTVTNIAANAFGGVDFDRLDSKLPWAIDYDNDGYNKAVTLMPEVQNWQDYSITVANLPTGSYNVLCDGIQIGIGISDATLATRWNMSDLQVGSVFNQVQEVLGRIRDMQGINRITLVNIGPPWKGVVKYVSNAQLYYGTNGQRGASLIVSLQPAITEINNYDALIHAAAQPVTHHYSIQIANFSPTPTVVPTATPTPTCSCTCP